VAGESPDPRLRRRVLTQPAGAPESPDRVVGRASLRVLRDKHTELQSGKTGDADGQFAGNRRGL